MEEKIKVISVFAGLGKTTVGEKYSNVCDLRTSTYRFIYTEEMKQDLEKYKEMSNQTKNPDWPQNYIKELKNAIEKYDLVLVPSNLDIRAILQENNIPFLFILPSLDSKEELIKRYQKRGNSEQLIENILSYFETWSWNQKDYHYPIEILPKGQYLENFLLKKEWIKREEQIR